MNLNSSIQKYNSSLEKTKQAVSGLLGLAIGGSKKVNIETRNGFVYVRLRDNLSEVIQAFNDKVSPVYDFPVLIKRKGNRWYVTGRDDNRYDDWGTSSPYLPQHGNQHSFNRDSDSGGDTVFVFPDQFIPLLVYPSGTNGAANLQIAPYLLQRDADFIYVGNTGTGSLLIYKPTNNQAIMGLVYLNTDTGNPGILINSGTYFSASITGANGVSPYIPYPASNQEPLYAFRLVSGTSELTWENLYNARQFIGKSTSTGSSGSSLPSFITGSVPFSGENGLLKENNSYLNFDENNGTLWAGRKPPANIAFGDFRFFARATGTNAPVAFGGIVAGTGTAGSPSMAFNGYRSRGTFDIPLPVQYGDALATYIGNGFDGSDWQNAGRARFYADGDWVTGTYLPTRYEVEITPSGSATRRTQFTVYGNSVNQPTGSTYNVGGIPHNHNTDYAPIAKGVTNGDSHDHSGGDGAPVEAQIVGDEATLKNRRDNGQTLNQGFDDATIPTGYSWAGDPFVTPTTVDFTTYPSMMRLADPSPIRSFLFSSTIPSASIYCVCGWVIGGSSSFIGFRADNGTDNNYFEWLLSGDLKGTIRTRVGGGAVATVQGSALPIPMLYGIRAFKNGTLYSSWGAHVYLTSMWQGAIMQKLEASSATTNASWTPTRFGIVFVTSAANNIAVVDSILGT